MRPQRRNSLIHEGGCPCARCRFEFRFVSIVLGLLVASAFAAWLYLVAR